MSCLPESGTPADLKPSCLPCRFPVEKSIPKSHAVDCQIVENGKTTEHSPKDDEDRDGALGEGDIDDPGDDSGHDRGEDVVRPPNLHPERLMHSAKQPLERGEVRSLVPVPGGRSLLLSPQRERLPGRRGHPSLRLGLSGEKLGKLLEVHFLRRELSVDRGKGDALLITQHTVDPASTNLSVQELFEQIG